MTKHKKAIIIGGIILAIILIAIFVILHQFSAPQSKAEVEQFTVAIGDDDSREIADQLYSQGFVRSKTAFNIALLGLGGMNSICVDCILPGAYNLSKSMNTWEIVKTLQQGPSLKWVIIPEGLRKEQIADILAQILGWNVQERSDWVTKYTAMNWDYIEGVYFPDTYLIPIDESGLEVAQRFINRFNQKFAPYSDKFMAANIKWDTALKIASLIQREAAGKQDMPLIAGIIWNRLLKNMKLDIDASLQYIRDSQLAYTDVCKTPGTNEEWPCQCGEEDDNCYKPQGYYQGLGRWWRPITVSDKQTDSAYNTYLNKGLPPHPIANPGLDAIEAVLNPTKTDCLYYLHANRQIHCAATYEEHKENVEKYLK